MNTKVVWSVIIALLVGGVIGYYLAPGSSKDPADGYSSATEGNENHSEKELALYSDMRKLWTDHVFWTREYIVATVDGSPSATQAAARLMKNQEDIGTAIAAYYGAQAGDQLTELLQEHISIAVDIVAAAKTNDQTKFEDANTRWQVNADQIATFLSQANPNWPKATLADLMNMHLKTTADELTARLNKQYDEDIAAFDAVFDHILHMSDALSAGLIKQFPDKFE